MRTISNYVEKGLKSYLYLKIVEKGGRNYEKGILCI